jgi:catechol 2,3-dioxygenase-like lactoylglutathione lyase family enzyme
MVSWTRCRHQSCEDEVKVHMKKNRLIAAIVCAILFVLSSSAQIKRDGHSAESPLGNGRGADHVMVTVRDINAASETFRKALGFNISQKIKFPEGIENSVIHFRNRSFFELLGVYDPEKAKGAPEVKFLENFEGGTGFGVHVVSAERTFNFLKGLGIEALEPQPFPPVKAGESPGMWIWRTVEFKKPLVPGGNVFLIEYNEPFIDSFRLKNPQKFEADRTHPNTAERLQAVWVAVKDLDAAVKAYESIGFSVGRHVALPHLAAKGREVKTGESLVLLLQSSEAKGEVFSFLANRDEGVMGVSIKVAKLNTARELLEANLKQKLRTYTGAYGKSVLIPVEVTRGIRIELFE